MISAYLAGMHVFPAPAGMNRNHRKAAAAGVSVPRACGDEPLINSGNMADVGCSPRLRG